MHWEKNGDETVMLKYGFATSQIKIPNLTDMNMSLTWCLFALLGSSAGYCLVGRFPLIENLFSRFKHRNLGYSRAVVVLN